MKILDVKVDPFTIDELHQTMGRAVAEGRHVIISNVNVHAINLTVTNPWLKRFFNEESDHVFCDGDGVIWGGKILGQRIPEKITYAHWFPLFCDYAAANGISIYLLGSKPGVAERAKECLQAGRPQLNIVGVHDGYFDKTSGSEDNDALIDAINAVKPNILLVAFGMPMQEQWLAENWGRINANVALTGGAAIDYMAGESKRPPMWMTDHGLEWLGRMLYEPKRLWKRYLIGNPLFIARVLKQRWRGGRTR